jgi:ABC transport system ATP-binding/permease protein
MKVQLTLDQPDGQPKIVEADGPCVRVGRDPECEVAIDPVAFAMVSGTHVRIERGTDGFVLTHLSMSNKTLVNDLVVKESTRIKVGDRIRLGFTGPLLTVRSLENTQDGPRATRRFDATMKVDARQLALARGTIGARRISIGEGGVIGRNPKLAQFHLDHPHVSAQHASVAVNGPSVILTDLNSSNGTFLNGRRLSRPAVLNAGDRIDIGPFSLQFDGEDLVSRSRSNNVELAALGLKRVVQDRTTGKQLSLLDEINLVVRSREFVCLLGPSGSGKSTLLAILSGRNPPNAGTVALNGQDLYAHFEVLKEDIAVVPQKDVVHESLALAKAVRYTAELRLPPDMSPEEMSTSVAEILEVVGLTRRRDSLIRHLSGGQLKRASLANELVARPSLLFLDEVTSGLDEQTDREVMELFRQVADGGKTVVCITHNLANVEATCHLVIILTEGGRLAFIGSPDEAKTYFQISRLGDVYKKLAQATPDEWHNRFRSCPYYRRYVADRMPSDLDREPETPPAVRTGTKSWSFVRQAWVLIRRYISIWQGDRNALLALLVQSVLVAILLGLAYGRLNDETDAYQRVWKTVNLFLLQAVTCFWFGCNTAAKELVKERVIFLRERDFNLRVISYFGSKIFVLTLIVLTQTTLLFGIVRVWCQLPGSLVLEWLTLATLAVVGTALGLLISAIAQSEEVATALIPIVVVPQIILAGVIARLSGLAKFLANAFMSVYWGQQALEHLLPESDLKYVGREGGNWFNPWIVVLAHAVVGTVAAIVVLTRTEARSRPKKD